jgi:hypothetical protein
MSNPKYYELICQMGHVIKHIKIMATHDDWQQYDRRIKRELFGKGKELPFKILNSKIVNQNLGL